VMCLPVIDEPDAGDRLRGRRHRPLTDDTPATHLEGSRRRDHTARAIAEHQLEAAPRARDTWVDHELRAAEPKPRIDSSPARYIHPADPVYHVHPPRADVRRLGIDVRRHDVRLDLVAVDTRWGLGMVIGSHRKELGGLIPVTERREGDRRPDAACVYCPPFSRTPGTYP